MRETHIGVIGCGFVFDKYMPTWANHPYLILRGISDINPDRRATVSAYYNLRSYDNNEELLADPRIDIVANFTPIRAHYEVSKAALLAGKHVYSEKPLVTCIFQARELIELAEQRGLRISCAPSNFLGATSQTIFKAVVDGAIGEPRLAYAEFDAGPTYLRSTNSNDLVDKDTSFPFLHLHSTLSATGAPFPFVNEFEMGCTYEHVAYHLSWMCATFGPVRRVTAFSKQIMPDKIDVPLDPADTPDFSVAVLDFHSGMTGRVTCSIGAPNDTRMRVMGTRGALSADTYGDYICPVFLHTYSKIGNRIKRIKQIRKSHFLQWLFGVEDRNLPLVEMASAGRVDLSAPWYRPIARFKQLETLRQDKCIGLAEMARALTENRVHFPPHDFTFHITELTIAISAAGTNSETYVVESSFDPIPMAERTREAPVDYRAFRRTRWRARVLERLLT